jgi:hypothetical protein
LFVLDKGKGIDGQDTHRSITAGLWRASISTPGADVGFELVETAQTVIDTFEVSEMQHTDADALKIKQALADDIRKMSQVLVNGSWPI